MSITDPSLQRMLKIRSLLDCPGLHIYENMVRDLLLCEQVATDKFLSKPIGEEERMELNEHSAQKRALEKVLTIRAQLEDELQDEQNSPTEALN